MKKFIMYLFSMLSILSICYYSVKFYFNGSLEVGSQPLLLWVIVLCLLIITLNIGVYNIYRNAKLEKKQEQLVELIKVLLEKEDDNCDKILESIYNSRDISLDTYNILIKENK